MKQCLLAIGLLSLYCSGFAYAADIDLGVSTGAGYSSNVFRSDADPEGDIYFKLIPKAVLKFPFHKASLNSSSHVVLEQYLSREYLNLREIVFSGSGNYNPSHRMSFGLRDQLLVSGRLESIEELTDLITDVARQRDFLDNRFSSSFRYELKGGISALSLIYSNTIRNYGRTEESNWYDWTTHSGQIRIEQFLGHRTSVQVSSALIRKTYGSDVDYISIPITATLERQLSDKIDAGFSLGSGVRKYNETYKHRNMNETNVSLVFAGRFNFMTIPRLTLRRRVYDSDFATGYSFVSEGGDIALNLNLIDTAQLTLRGIYSRNSYMQLKSKSTLFAGYGTIRYRLLKWAVVILGYGYRKSDSIVPALNYQRHVITLSLAGNATLWLI